MTSLLKKYSDEHISIINFIDEKKILLLMQKLKKKWKNKNSIYICGNGGSGANAIHIGNDLIYAASRSSKRGLNINCLNSNSSVLTCLGNDTNFKYISSKQSESKA